MLANDINKSRGLISDIEHGRTYPTFKVLMKISDACEVPFSFFDKTNNELDPKDFTNKKIDVKETINLVLSAPLLTLNGKLISKDSRIALTNAVNLGLQYAEKLQEKEKEKYLS